MSVRRQKTVFAALVLAGAALGFVSASRPWVRVAVTDLAASGTLRVTGRQAAGVVPAVALVALAGAVAVLTTRRVGQVVAGALLALAGAAAATVSLGVLRSPTAAVTSAVTAATGRTGAEVTTVVTTWPLAGVISGVLIALAGCLAVGRARAWGGLSARYDTPAETARTAERPATGATGADDDPGLVWDRLTRGEDPTDRDALP